MGACIIVASWFFTFELSEFTLKMSVKDEVLTPACQERLWIDSLNKVRTNIPLLKKIFVAFIN